MAKIKEKEKKKRNKRLIFWIQLVIAVLLVATISGGLLQLGTSEQKSSEAPDFPPWIAGLRIQNYLAGDDAKGQMLETYGQDINLRNAWTAFYSEGAVVWVGQANSESEAEKLLNIMREKTQSAISSFPDLKLQASNQKGLTIYSVRFKDQDNYIYQRKDKVFWVAVPYSKAEPFLKEVISDIN